MKPCKLVTINVENLAARVAVIVGSVSLLSACGGSGGMSAGQPAAPGATTLATGVMSAQAAATAVTTTTTTTGTNVYAASCAYSAVQASVTSAAAGTTVHIPAGYCDWGTNQLYVLGGVALKGAGRDATVIRRTVAVPDNTFLVRYDCANGRQARFSDIQLVGANLSTSQDRGLGLTNTCVDFVVTNSKFTGFVFSAVELRGNPAKQRGVIYNNQFINNYNSTVRNLGYGVAVFGDGSWPALELGTANNVFIEDNYMYGNRHHVAANNGARYVFRHNTGVATDLTKDFAQVDAHGLSSSPRGTRQWEVYGNTFSTNLTSGRNYAAVTMRGGDGVIFNNTYKGAYGSPVALWLEGGTCGNYPVQDQVRQAYIAEAVAGPVLSKCATSVAIDRDYFLTAMPGYAPYAYPHPARAL